ncbi:MAG: hypothetical protein KKF44_00970 [Nanoarchaeota archaeon]|nr:hypothetical protein [Nanoarchaeota archaeon]
MADGNGFSFTALALGLSGLLIGVGLLLVAVFSMVQVGRVLIIAGIAVLVFHFILFPKITEFINAYKEDSENGKSRYVLFLLFFIFIHLMDAANNFSRDAGSSTRFFGAYILLGQLGFWLVFAKEYNSFSKEFIIMFFASIFISILSWLVPILIKTYIPVNGFFSLISITATITIAPAWLIFLYFYKPAQESRALNILLDGYIAFWFIMLIMNYLTFDNFGRLATTTGDLPVFAAISRLFAIVLNAIASIISLIMGFVTSVPTVIATGFDNAVQVATGRYYGGEEEESEDDRQLGITLDKIQSDMNEYYIGDPVSVWAKLQARTLDERMNIQFSCYAVDAEENKISGTTDPQTLSVDSFEEEMISCDFGEGALAEGYYKVVIVADFNFETTAYLKVFFMNKDTIRALTREGKEAQQEYPIIERTNAIYTEGPIGIGMETVDNPPIGVPAGDTAKPFLGITIDNRWNGIIDNVNNLNIMIPQTMELDTSLASCKFVASGTEGENSVYVLQNPGTIGPIEYYKSFRCKVIVDLSDLDDVPVTVRYFRAKAAYDYIISAETTVQIQPEEEVM